MRQVKSYVELHNYQETTSFGDAERVVSSYLVTSAISALAARILNDLAAPRGANPETELPALQVITGQRGVGKSHLLAFLRSIIEVKALRGMIADSNILNAIGLFSNKVITAVEINFSGQEHETFENCLRSALCQTLKHSAYFDDEKWAAAVKGEQVFEQVLGGLPLGTQLILFIDNLSSRWREAPEQVEADLDWLALLGRQASSLPLRAIIVRDEEPGLIEGEDSAVYTLLPDSLREVVTRRVLLKNSQQLRELEELYGEQSRLMPEYSCSKEEFVNYYPVHPIIFESAPFFRAVAPSFSLAGFVYAAVSRVLNRPANSLVTPDEVFDRYEYEFRKSSLLEDAFKTYDQIVTVAVSKLPVSNRLWAKLALKALFIYSLAGKPVSAREIAQAQMLIEEGDPMGSYARVATILDHFVAACPEAFLTQGSSRDCNYLLSISQEAVSTKFEHEIRNEARAIPDDDPRLTEMLLGLGLGVFQDLQSLSGDVIAGQGLPAYLPQRFSWRGSLRGVEVCLAGQGETESQWRLLVGSVREATAEQSASAAHIDEFTIIWQPDFFSSSSALSPLKKLLVLNQLANSPKSIARPEDIEAKREKLCADVRSLFIDLYLKNGTLVDAHQSYAATPFTERSMPEWEFSDFLHHAFDKLFSHHFPHHPHFAQGLTETQAETLIGKFFTGQDDELKTPEVQQLAEAFAVPLGVTSKNKDSAEAAEIYQPDIFSEQTQPRPFVQAILGFIDHQTDETGLANVPLIQLERLLNESPYGLQRVAQKLLIGALIATNLIECVDEQKGQLLNKETLTLNFDLSAYAAVRRVASISYPSLVLADWARLLTGRDDLPLPATADSEKRVREAFREWLATWREDELNCRFEQLPLDMQTLGSWRTLNASKLRFSRVSALAQAVVEGTIEVRTALSRIADIFGLDRSALIRLQDEMRALGDFLDWMPAFSDMRNYLLAAEPTSDSSTEELRTELTLQIQDSRTFLEADLRRGLEVKFAEFRKRYSEFYAEAHEAEVGPSANRQLIASFCASPEWVRFRLLIELKLEGGAFDRDSQALLKLAQETRCDLPVADLLQHQPHCCCSFRLHRQVHLGSLLEALKSIVSAASTYYSLAIWRHRSELRAKAAEAPDEAFRMQLEDFLAACGNGDLSDLTPELISFINNCLSKQPAMLSVSML